MKAWTRPLEAAAAGAVCLLILIVMIVLHAWPLWTGRVVTLPVTTTASDDPFRGDLLSMAPPGGRVVVGSPAATAPTAGAIVLPPVGDWWSRVPADRAGRRRALLARVVYVQLAPSPAGGEYRPVSIAGEPVEDGVNLRGRIRDVDPTGTLEIDCGISAYYVEEGRAQEMARALKAGSHVQVQIAIARSGRARIKTVLVDGTAI